HRADTAHMRLLREFLLQIRLRRTAGAVKILAVAALSHEARDNAVERHAVIIALVGQLADALHMLRSQIGPELDHDIARVELKRQGMKGIIAHQCLSLFSRGTRAGICTSQTEKSAPRSRRVSSTSSRNCGPSVRST